MRPCSVPGCPELIQGGGPNRCEQHRRQENRRRGSAHSRGYGRRWEKIRAIVLARDPVCTCSTLDGCEHAPGECYRLSTDVDHIIPRERGGSDALENLQGLCHGCHARKTALEDGGFGR